MLAIATRLNRTMKLALDDGSAASIEDARDRFLEFRLCLDIRGIVSSSPGLEAALLTLLNAAPRTFLGGVELVGEVDQRLQLAWFEGKSIAEVARSFGVSVTREPSFLAPTLVLGPGVLLTRPFVLAIECTEAGFRLCPDQAHASSRRAPVECGVAAAGAALSEAFQFVYAHSPLAGQRRILFDLPPQGLTRPQDSLWTVGLGHLGQAALWTLALRHRDRPKSLRLQDPDCVSESNLSTCLLTSGSDIGRLKVDAVAERLEQLGIRCARVPETLTLPQGADGVAHDVALISVDNVDLRRSLDAISGSRIVEAGIGEGTTGYTLVQIHALPGPRTAADIWAAGDPRASQIVDISAPAYQQLLTKTKDECGTTLLAGRSIATPFVGAFAGACMVAVSSAVHARSDWSLDVRSL